MKFSKEFRIILIIVLLAFDICSSLRRRRHKKNKTRDGEGSWETGFLCPHIMITGKDNITLDYKEARFYPKNFITDKTIINEYDRIGFVLDFRNKISPQKEIFFQVDKQPFKFYIPFRYFENDFIYKNPKTPFTNKFIEGTLKDDLGQKFILKIVLPYAATTWYINDKEGTTIATELSEKGRQQRRAIKVIKDDLNPLFSKLEINTSLFVASSDMNTLQSMIDFKKKEIESKKGELKTNQLETDNLNSKINPLSEELDRLKKEKSSLEEKYKFISNEISEFEKIQNENESLLKNQKKARDDLGNIVVFTKDTINKKLEELKAIVPEKSIDVDSMNQAINNLNENDYIGNLNKLRSDI